MEINLKEADKDNLESIKMENFNDPICEENIVGDSPLFAFALCANEDEREISFVILPDKLASKKTDTEL